MASSICIIFFAKPEFNTSHRLFIHTSAGVLVWMRVPGFLNVCHYSYLWFEFSKSRTYWIKTLSSYHTQKVLPHKHWAPAEEWDYLEVDVLKHTCSARVCMWYKYFNYYCESYFRTIFTCHFLQRLIPLEEYLTSKCRYLIQQLERKIVWPPELIWSNDKKQLALKIAREIYKGKGKLESFHAFNVLVVISMIFPWMI